MKPNPDLAIEIVEGEMIVLDKTAGKVHQLNSTASFVWNCLVDGHGPEEIAEMLSEEFDITPSTALSDVSLIIEEFRRTALLVD